MMEIERLKALKVEEDRERARALARRKGAEVIVDQIKQRTLNRISE